MTVAAPCKHWDRIESPHGPVVKAVCIFCGRLREYRAASRYGYNVTETLQARRNEGV